MQTTSAVASTSADRCPIIRWRFRRHEASEFLQEHTEKLLLMVAKYSLIVWMNVQLFPKYDTSLDSLS
jgi:hypothetical protein